jgi:hypothetical protein
MGFVPNLPQTLLENDEFVADLARFAEGLYSEQAIRKKYHFDEDEWRILGEDDALLERIELEKTRRIRSGAAKREKAQQHVVKAPDVLDKILCDERASPKHRIDAAKALDDLADNGPQSTPEADRFIIRIDLTAGGGEVIEFDKALKVDPNPNIIDGTPEELPPPKRRPGRPKGSRNKQPKAETAPETLLPFITNQRTDGGGSGEPI